MSLVSAATTRFATSALYLARLAIHRLGLGTVLLAATAAAALVLSWRAARRAPPANPPRRRRRHRPNSGVSRSDAHQTADPNRVETHLARSAADTKPRWLSRVRRVTIGAKWSLDVKCDLFCESFELEGSAQGGKRVAVRPEVVEALRRFARLFDLYVIVEVDDDQGEEAVKAALKAVGLFEHGLLDERKLLFCETDMGRVSVARQIESHLHVDESVAVVTDLQRFLPYVSLVSANAKALNLPSGSNVTKFTTLASFFS